MQHTRTIKESDILDFLCLSSRLFVKLIIPTVEQSFSKVINVLTLLKINHKIRVSYITKGINSGRKLTDDIKYNKEEIMTKLCWPWINV